MEEPDHISLDASQLRARMRRPERPVVRRPVMLDSVRSRPIQPTSPRVGLAGRQQTTPTSQLPPIIKHDFKPPATIKKAKHRRATPAVLTGMAIVLFAVGAFVAANGLQANKMVKAQAQHIESKQTNASGSTTSTSPKPAEKPSTSTYNVAPDMPKFFTVNKINIFARIIPLGLTKSGALATPNNVYDVGWYSGSSKPGQPGTALMDGHVSSWTNKGVFYNIKTLRAGDKIQITMGDNTVLNYTVTGSQVYDKDKVDMNKAMTSSVTGKNGLNFITCTGKYNASEDQFAQRIVVFATQD